MLLLRRYCSFYKDLAIGVLNECYSTNQHTATLLLVHKSTDYGNATPLQLAVYADNKEFVAHPACQDALTTIWFGRLRKHNYSRMITKV